MDGEDIDCCPLVQTFAAEQGGGFDSQAPMGAMCNPGNLNITCLVTGFERTIIMINIIDNNKKLS